MSHIDGNDPRIPLLQGKRDEGWWDVIENQFVPSDTLYIPFGCPDWGERNGKRNNLCTFCALPNAVAEYRQTFYKGAPVPAHDLINLFAASLTMRRATYENTHTLMIFNAGSFLAMDAGVQRCIIEQSVNARAYKCVVIESRAELITEERIASLGEITASAGVRMLVRVGVETQDDRLRLQVLRKGHSRAQLYKAKKVMQEYGVLSGGYALLNPAPGLDPEWALQEVSKTIDWVLGSGDEQLGMNEAYFCSTNVGPGTSLEDEWRAGRFSPASFWMVLHALQGAVRMYGNKVHLLPFKDEPALLAIPSNHVQGGISQDLSGAQGCDPAFYEMFERYRSTRDPRVLVPPQCSCRPKWF